MSHKQKSNSFWMDWKWQLTNAFHTAGTIKEYIELPEFTAESEYIALTPYMLDTIVQAKPEHQAALIKQFIPIIANGNFYFSEIDSLNEAGASVAENLVRKHKNRVALIATSCCACFCQFCTRREIVYRSKNKNHMLQDALKYIRAHPEINDVLITGGDPLILDTPVLEQLLEKLYAIEHIRVMRIGTRAPITLPMRVNAELIDMLLKYSPLYINIHVNHPAEITSESEKAILSLANAGIPLGSQSVLLKGINDDAIILHELYERLVRIKVRPYYLYQCDKMCGCENFYVPITEGIKIINELNYNLSGLAVPRYVVDSPDLSKLTIGPNNIHNMYADKIEFTNHEGQLYEYDIMPKGYAP